MEDVYRRQVELLIRCLPEVEKQTCFALKGGTAINLFVRNMPRLSIDIDLVYLPIEPREQTLVNIGDALNGIANNIKRFVAGSTITKISKENSTNKLLIEYDGVRIKIEPNIVQRGVIFKTEEHHLCERAETEFEVSATVSTIAVTELYGSKIAAALDRQHPRDLFDIKLLFENEGIADDIRTAFVIYLASHPRPMNELLNPNLKDIEQEFYSQFQGMTNIPVELISLLDTREQLVKLINEVLTDKERRFLISIKSGIPDWSLMDIQNIEQLPAIQWKLRNIGNMDERKQQEAVDKLKKVLGL
jgi:predicted nucleotidyltransferase component of viral defense system